MAFDGPITIVNLTRGTTLATAGRRAHNLWRRFSGLMGRPVLPGGAGLVFAPCTGLHTCFMRFPLDLLYVDLDEAGGCCGAVVRVRESLPPFRVAPARADLVVELPAGTIARTSTAVGDRIVLRAAADRPGMSW